MTVRKSVLASILGRDPSDVIDGGMKLYHSFEVKPRKKNHKPRQILAPCDDLKAVQKSILEKILNHVSPHHAATAFFKGRSIAGNARLHHHCLYLYKTDISNFFPSIKVSHVWRVLETHFPHISRSAMDEIVRLTTLEGTLPQGAPTSPHLANLALFEFDEQLTQLCNRLGARYTRYADDITVSAADEQALESAEGAIRAGLSELGLAQHVVKTHRFGPNMRKLVTGLDVSADTIRPPRSYRKKVAALVRMCETYPSRMARHAPRVLGYLAHWQGTTPDDPELKRLKQRMKHFQRGNQKAAESQKLPNSEEESVTSKLENKLRPYETPHPSHQKLPSIFTRSKPDISSS